MEKVDLPTVEAWISGAHDKAEMRSRLASALGWLFNLSPPAGAGIGLTEGVYAQIRGERARTTSGRALRPFFGNSSVPYHHTNVLAREKHINEVWLTASPYFSELLTTFTTGSWPPFGGAPQLAVNIANEPLVMVQGGIKQHNFLIDPETL